MFIENTTFYGCEKTQALQLGFSVCEHIRANPKAMEHFSLADFVEKLAFDARNGNEDSMTFLCRTVKHLTNLAKSTWKKKNSENREQVFYTLSAAAAFIQLQLAKDRNCFEYYQWFDRLNYCLEHAAKRTCSEEVTHYASDLDAPRMTSTVRSNIRKKRIARVQHPPASLLS